MATLLVHHFETVFYARADLLAKKQQYGRLSEAETSNLRFPFEKLIAGLDALQRGTLTADVIERSEAVLVGARDFRSPGGPPPHLGPARSRFCYVVLGSPAVDLRRHFSEPPVGRVGGQEIWHWVAEGLEGEDGPVPFYAMRVAPSYLIVSNSIDDLRTVANALLSPKLPKDIVPEAEVVGKHRIWGFRRARLDRGVRSDRLLGLPPSVDSLLLLVDVYARRAVLRAQLAPSAQAVPELRANLPPFRRTGPRSWETVVPLTGDTHSLEITSDVVSLFGFAIFM